MKIRLIAIGRMQDRAMAELIERYRRRLPWKLDIIELVPRGKHVGQEAEAELIGARIEAGHRLVALDERGDDLQSRELAGRIAHIRDLGIAGMTIIIGGADGIAPKLRASADELWAFGRATWPHMLVRVMLVEQLYRASSILSGHPYHRD